MEILNHFEKYESYIPVDLLSIKGFLLCFFVVSLFIIIRYFGFVLLFYVPFWSKKFFSNSQIYLHDQQIRQGQINFEIRWSMISSLIFAMSAYLIGVLWQLGWSQIYLSFNQYPLYYLPLSFLIYTLVHEVYFYFTHVFMHRPKIYPWMHSVHHFSHKTSPFACFSFHPLEAVVHALFLPLMIIIIPIHPVVLISYLTFMTLTSISNHLGVEILHPWLQKIFISGAHHATHHRRFHYNFGLYYCFMDRLFQTEKIEEI